MMQMVATFEEEHSNREECKALVWIIVRINKHIGFPTEAASFSETLSTYGAVILSKRESQRN